MQTKHTAWQYAGEDSDCDGVVVDRDPKVLLKLSEDWESDTMHAHGWACAPQPALSAPLRLVPRGRG
ncbi:hypothetical protein [Streptomyces sp. NPDC001675]